MTHIGRLVAGVIGWGRIPAAGWNGTHVAHDPPPCDAPLLDANMRKLRRKKAKERQQAAYVRRKEKSPSEHAP